MSDPRPLDGLLVADLSRVLAGPLAAQTLGDLGAEVIKVEPRWGDDTRRWGPPFDEAGQATYHHAANRNKRSIALDFGDEEDRALAEKLCRRADVVVANLRPGTLERFDLGYESVSAENPGVIYCEITGFGDDAGDLPGYDPLIQAMGGLMSVTGPPGGAFKVGVALVDVLAGLYATTSINAALLERARSGCGQRITLNLLHVVLAGLANQATGYLGTGVSPVALGNTHPSIEPFATFRCAGGDLMICAGSDRQFSVLVTLLGSPGLAQDPRFATNASRVEHRAALRERLEEDLAGRTAESWSAELLAAGVPAGPVNDLEGGFGLAERLGLGVVDQEDGVRTVRFPGNLSRTPAGTSRRPPGLDEHGDEIRSWLAEP